MTQLNVARFENNDAGAAILGQFFGVEGLGIRWSLDAFGVERIEFVARTDGQLDAYQHYEDHLGQRVAVYSPTNTRPVTGWITEVELMPGNRVRYVAKGPGMRMEDRLITRQYTSTTSIANVVENIVYRYCPFADKTDLSNIYTNSITVNGWGVRQPEGSTPAEAITDILRFSDASYRIRDFWMVDQPFNGTSLRQLVAHYYPRTTTATADWVINRSDLTGLQFARSLEKMVTSVRVYYGNVTGTITALGTNTLTDSSATFITDGVTPGDMLVNTTRGGSVSIISVNGQTELTISEVRSKHIGRATGGSHTSLIDTTVNFTELKVAVNDILKNNADSSVGTITSIATTTNTDDTLQVSGGMFSGATSKTNNVNERYEVVGTFATGNTYAIETTAKVNFVEVSTTTPAYWERELSVFEPTMDATQAEQYANSLLVDEPQQVQAFVISAPTIRDASGSRWWPLLEVIARGGGYIQIADLYPEASLITGGINRRTTFFITSLEYNDNNKTLRVGVDNPDRRLDATLARNKILTSAGIF